MLCRQTPREQLCLTLGKPSLDMTAATNSRFWLIRNVCFWPPAHVVVPLSNALPYDKNHRVVQRMVDVLAEAEIRFEHIQQGADPAGIVVPVLIAMRPYQNVTKPLDKHVTVRCRARTLEHCDTLVRVCKTQAHTCSRSAILR